MNYGMTEIDREQEQDYQHAGKETKFENDFEQNID